MALQIRDLSRNAFLYCSTIVEGLPLLPLLFPDSYIKITINHSMKRIPVYPRPLLGERAAAAVLIRPEQVFDRRCVESRWPVLGMQASGVDQGSIGLRAFLMIGRKKGARSRHHVALFSMTFLPGSIATLRT